MSECYNCRFNGECILPVYKNCKFFKNKYDKPEKVKLYKHVNKCVLCYDKFNSDVKEYFCIKCSKKRVQKKLV